MTQLTYEELSERLSRAESLLDAILKGEVDTVGQGDNISLVLPKSDLNNRLTAMIPEHTASLVRAKSDFLSNMSHEILTPLNGVYGFLQLVIKSAKKEPPEMGKIIERANLGMKSCQHLINLINEILDFSKK